MVSKRCASRTSVVWLAALVCVACSESAAPDSVAAISLDRTSLAVGVGATTPLTAYAYDADGNVLDDTPELVWSSANMALATVDADGMVRGVALGGPVAITVTRGDRSATAHVLVTPASVVVSPATETLAVGATVQLSATAYDAAGTVLNAGAPSWAIHDVSIPGAVHLSASGVLTAIAPALARIDASIAGATATYTIGVPGPFDGLWSGTDGWGFDVVMTVEFGSVTRFALPRILLVDCTMSQFNAALSTPIADAHFTATLIPPSGIVTGSFDSPNVLTGSHGTLFLGIFACDNRILTNPHNVAPSTFTLSRIP